MRLAVIALAISLTACQHRPAKQQISIVVRPDCLTKSVLIDNCDVSTDPPKCKGPTHVYFKSGCEQVQIPK